MAADEIPDTVPFWMIDRAEKIVRDDDDLHLDIDAEALEDGRISLRRTVNLKAYRSKDRHILDDKVLVELTQAQAVRLITDLALALRSVEKDS